MPYSLRLIFILLISLLGYFSLGDFVSACPFYNPGCDTSEIPYCVGSECSQQSGVSAVFKALLPSGWVTDKSFSQFAQEIVVYLLGFLTIIAVIYIMYAGFQVMTGGGDEEKTKKAKKIITYVAVGVVIILLSYTFVSWIINTVIPATSSTTQKNHFSWSLFPSAHANNFYSENEKNTFLEYKNKISITLQEIEGELRINKRASNEKLQNLKNLVQQAYERLPDVGEAGLKNDTEKRQIDIEIAIAMNNLDSVSIVGSTLGKVYAFLEDVVIERISGDIVLGPKEGNAPLTVSFSSKDIKDPSGSTPQPSNYNWWMRGSGGRRIDLGNGSSFHHTFNQEGTHTIFLDVTSTSKNSKGMTDVLPLTVSKQIEVRPKLGEIVLLINGVNVSNITSLKVSPNVGKLGILFDATASRSIENGIISSTEWDFGNGQTLSYKGNPIVERQLYVNPGIYSVKLTLKSNTDVKFVKEITLVIRDPSAVIDTEKTTGNIGEEMNFKSFSYFTQQNNIDYSWRIINTDNQIQVKSANGPSLSHKFTEVGEYTVSLTSRSPNGSIDADSETIIIESREPIVNLAIPKPEGVNKPNIIVFDASKSYDPDTMSRKGLTFTWRLDGEKITLDNESADSSFGKYTFDSVGTHTISLSVSNKNGKITTVEKPFTVNSILSVNLIATPSVAPIGSIVNLIAQSENAGFYEWDMGDGSSENNGSKRVIQHVFKKTGTYNVKLKVRSKDGVSTNETSRIVYVTDANTPFASINASNPSSSVYEDANACNNSGAIIINRSEITTLDGGDSINIDGSTEGLSYTWEYFEKVKTTEKISQKFVDLGCFPIKLTVRSNTNGSTHTSTKYLSIRNEKPDLTSITTSIDATKKDAQKVLVKVTANGARDPDGVITSYIWFYTTESDKEPQNIQITQKNEITFVLPNITEKYYFGVILEDNDGGRKNSTDDSVEQMPLLIDNQDGNIYLPLISLTGPKIGLAGEQLKFSAEAKTIVGTNITNKAEYAWDFDGDGKIDEKTTSPTINYAYKASGVYTIKLRVTNNGVSNTKYITVTIKNPLKADFQGYTLPNGDVYLLNTSKGPYEKTSWNIGGEVTESLYSLRIKNPQVGENGDFGKLTVSTIEGDTDSINLNTKDIGEQQGSGLKFQSFPSSIDNTIHVSGPGERVLVSLIGNEGTRFVIDDDTSIDSSLDGMVDNDEDNKDTASYTDGSVYSIQDFSVAGNRSRTVKLSVYNGDTLVDSDTIKIIFDYIRETSTVSGEAPIMSTGSISSADRIELEKLDELIRNTDDSSRIILMQLKNLLIENWDDPFSKAKILIDMQEKVNELPLTSSVQGQFGASIDALLVGDATFTDEITIATKIIEGLIPESSENRSTILEKLSIIKSHPQLLVENKNIALEILKLVEADSSIETKYKLHIKNQLQIIVNGGQQEVPVQEPEQTGGIMGFIIGLLNVFFIIMLVIIVVVGIGYIFYRVTRKNTDIGFQDFLIDSISHSKNKTKNTEEKKYNPIEVKEVPMTVAVDPLIASYTPPTVTQNDPLGTISRVQAEVTESSPKIYNDSSVTENSYKDALTGKGIEDTSLQNDDESLVPDWLKVQKPNTEINLEAALEENQINIEEPKSGEIAIQETEDSANKAADSSNDEIIIQEIEPEKPEDILLVKDETASSGDLFTSTIESDSHDNSSNNLIQEESEENITQNTPPPPIERDASMPDWLSINPLPEIQVESNSSMSSGDSDISEVNKETLEANEKSPDTSNNDALPDWLVQSVQPSGNILQDTSESLILTESPDNSQGESLLEMIGEDQPKVKEKKPRSPKKKSEGTMSGETKKPDQHDNIPDWLK
ncbi:PKD domain-containing protein [Candidatus Gracilibacteria bacterium]|nr:PKD domain-containing protein [Candidatus Gracilibacteria bacterium]